MTHTTTDAAEARARAIKTACEALAPFSADPSDSPTRLALIITHAALFPDRPGCADVIARLPAMANALATAEAASGAGEREELAKLIAPFADYDGDLPDYDHPLRCVYESGVQYAVVLLAKTLDVKEWVPCDGTEEYDGDLGGTLLNIVLEAMPEDADGDRIHPRELPALLASLPPATDPAMVLRDKSMKSLGFDPADFVQEARGHMNDMPRCIQRDYLKLALEKIEAFLAALAAAPTIPATGEAVPAGMKPWHGEDGPPNDWDGGEVLLENGQMGDGNVWDHHPSRSPGRIIAYTPKATIPATGHAATVDPDDLRPWGYAPGEYVFRCRDCPADPPFEQRPIGDKRSWRCKSHAEAARDASGHAVTEGEG